jgi:hypothetical protein
LVNEADIKKAYRPTWSTNGEMMTIMIRIMMMGMMNDSFPQHIIISNPSTPVHPPTTKYDTDI